MSEESGEMDDEPEVLNGVPVLAEEAREVDPQRPPGALSPVAVQTVAVVGVSVLAGAAAVTIAHKRKARRIAKRGKRGRMLAPVLASRSFLVDVHVLGDRR
jgi:hypothetical protein